MIHETYRSPHQRRAVSMKLDHATCDVMASVVIGAEWRRILHALTIPEYMETWFEMPDVERVECRSEVRSLDRFRIDTFVAGARKQSIYGSCIRSKPDEITYLWDRTRAGSTARSIVKMRLKAGPRRCTLHLSHRGLWDEQERAWYSTMWRRSLHRLCGLMEGMSYLTH
jgi:uncharacterized protein YndB with AHSA1/START domain